MIYIDEVEKLFPKSKKKDGAGTSSPIASVQIRTSLHCCCSVREFVFTEAFARVGSALLAHKEQLSREHRVLIVGNSRLPFDESVDVSSIQECFGPDNYGKLVYTPCPSYDSRLNLWRHFIDMRVRLILISMHHHTRIH